MDEKTVTTEAETLGEAVRKAAELLGVPAEQVRHKLDFSHFRNEEGRAIPVDTVKAICWSADPQDTAGAVAAKEWLEGLVSRMGIEATVHAKNVADKSATMTVDSDAARFLVGRGGKTLFSISTLLNEAMSDEYGDWTFKMDILGGRRDEERRDDDRGRGRDDRGRDDRGRDDRGGDDRGRGRRDRDDRGGRPRRSERDVDELKKLARRLASNVTSGGEDEIIRKPLNSFERRIVHMEVAEIDGVATDTVEHDGERKIRIFADQGEDAGAEA
jgi:predicted RNA-binding protein Jag